MDDTQQTQANPMSGASMNDVAGMTPPPAPVMPDPAPTADPMPAMPSMPEPQVSADPMPTAAPMPAMDPKPAQGGDEDYSYAEDVLNEILDSLDRIEAKLEAMEKKMG